MKKSFKLFGGFSSEFFLSFMQTPLSFVPFRPSCTGMVFGSCFDFGSCQMQEGTLCQASFCMTSSRHFLDFAATKKRLGNIFASSWSFCIFFPSLGEIQKQICGTFPSLVKHQWTEDIILPTSDVRILFQPKACFYSGLSFGMQDSSLHCLFEKRDVTNKAAKCKTTNMTLWA